MRMIKVLHVITGLAAGGAEGMLARLVPRLRGQGVAARVLSLGPSGPLADQMALAQVPVQCLGMRPGQLDALAWAKFVRMVRSVRPDIIQSWMYHANLACLLTSPMLGVPVIWNVRQALYADSGQKASTSLVIRLSQSVSPRAVAIVYNSHVSRQHHERFGFSTKRGLVIPNGFDGALFRPDPDAARRVRRELGIPQNACLIGFMARLHPMKDHAGFRDAAMRLCSDRADVHWLLAGSGVNWENPQLAALLAGLPRSRFHCLGERHDMPALTAACDIATTCSWAEAFPNVLGEAMACGVPCVATDVGDCLRLVGDTGLVVPPRDPVALAGAWRSLLDLTPPQRVALGARARARILRLYDLEGSVARYARLYRLQAARLHGPGSGHVPVRENLSCAG